MINSIITSIYDKVSLLGNNVGVYRFGSSTRQTKFYNDIDILILVDDLGRDYSDLCKIYNGLLYEILYSSSNENTYLRLYHEEISSAIKDVVSDSYIGDRDIQPVFYYGPSTSIHNMNIQLHIKGPLDPSSFQDFIDKFPFHGISILFNNIGAGCSPRLLDYFSYSAPDINRYNIEKKALLKRLNSPCVSKEVCKKILKKLEHNLRIMNEDYSSVITIESLISEPDNVGEYVQKIHEKYL